MALSLPWPRIALMSIGFGLLFTISAYRSYMQHSIGSQPNSNQLLNEVEKIDTSFSSQCQNCSKASHNGENMAAPNPAERKLWVSMALCLSKNTKVHGKSKYPYALSAPLAILLWYHFVPGIRIIIYLVYHNSEKDDEHAKAQRKLYEDQLRQTNVEIRWAMSEDMDCVTKSQIIRMWAFQDHMIEDNDVVVTADVDLYVMTPKILDPIHEHPDLKVWLFQYDYTAANNIKFGETFKQNLISATAEAWHKIIEPREDNQLNQKWLDERITEIADGQREKYVGDDPDKYIDKWTNDQWICTYGILKNKLCTLPKVSGLWRTPGLVRRELFFPDMDDSSTCWHGTHYRDCNKEDTHITGGCKWWHFYPTQRFPEMVQRFKEITNFSYNLTFV